MNNKILKQIEKFVLPEITSKKPVFCVTGAMASGKNFVCQEFEKLGFISIDLDKEVHKVLEEKTEDVFAAFESIAEKQGIRIRTENNELDRRALGSLLFNNSQLLKKHESIIYPALTENIKAFIKSTNELKENRPKGIILNATVLYKTPKLLDKCDLIVYVQANWIKRFNRARKRDHMNEMHILQRFSAQKNLFEKYKQTGKQIIVVKN